MSYYLKGQPLSVARRDKFDCHLYALQIDGDSFPDRDYIRALLFNMGYEIDSVNQIMNRWRRPKDLMDLILSAIFNNPKIHNNIKGYSGQIVKDDFNENA